MRHLTAIIATSLLLAACESSPKTKRGAKPEPAKGQGAAAVHVEGDLLIERAQLLRDREFAKRPNLVHEVGYTPPANRFCDTRCQGERDALAEVLFAGEAPEQPRPVAFWDAENHQVVWDGSVESSEEVERAIVAAIVEGLDREAGPAIGAASTWDGALAAAATTRGPGVFVTFLREASDRASHVDAAALAQHPEALVELDETKRYVGSFAGREGFAFVAALHRADGWSAVELSHNRPPHSSLHVVRPDRYLAGDDTGEWEWAAEATAHWREQGFSTTQEGMVGPAVFVEWLSRHIPPMVARAAYLGWDSDAYRIWRKDDAWRWEWVSLWNTPSNAQQVVEALDAGLRKQGGGERYTVLRKGNTVAVLGSSSTLTDAELELAPLLVGMRPVFQPGEPLGLTFKPTPTDLLQSRELVTRVEPAEWTDSVTRAEIDLSPLKEWTVTPTTEPPLPWFAKHEDGSIFQWHVEPRALLAPPFGDQAYAAHLRAEFEKSAGTQPVVERVDRPVPKSLRVDLTEQVEGEGAETRTRAWHFAVGPYVVTASLRAGAAAFEERAIDVQAVVDSIELPDSTADQKSKGIIRFEVEE